MPVVTVEMFEGRSIDQKRRLVRAIADALVEHINAKPEGTHVIIHELPRQNWAWAGTLASDPGFGLTADPRQNADKSAGEALPD